MDFDQLQRERQEKIAEEFGAHPFTLRGERFYVGRNIPYAALRDVAKVTSSSSDSDAFNAIEESVLGMLQGGMIPDGEGGERMESRASARVRFLTVVRESIDFPVTYADLLEIHNWMIQEASGLPPTQPASSSGTPSQNGDSSTEPSSPAQDEVSKT